MRRYVTKKTVYFRRFLAALIICALTVFISAHLMLRQYADIVCRSSCSQYGEQLINEAVSEALQSFELDDLIELRQNDNGFSEYTVNSEQVNKISAFMIGYINNGVANDLHSSVSVPAGAFTGISFLSGSGPEVKIDIYSVGSPEIRLVPHFESSGINQTLFELYAEVSLDFSAVMPTKSVSVTTKRQVLLVQKVIIGEVPQLYYPQSE